MTADLRTTWEKLGGKPEHVLDSRVEKESVVYPAFDPVSGSLPSPQKKSQTEVKSDFSFDCDCKTKETRETKETVAVRKSRPERPREPIEPKTEQELIYRTIMDYDWAPDYGDKYIPPLWNLACRLSAYPLFRGLDADAVADYIQAVTPFRTFPCVDGDSDGPGRDQFIECWQALKPGPLGKEAYMIALSETKRELLPVHRLNRRAGTEHFNKVVNFCHRLQIVEGDNPVALSGRMLSDVLGIHYTNACLFTKRLQFEKFIECVEKPRVAQQRAGRYRFVGEVMNGALWPKGTKDAIIRQLDVLTRRIALLESKRKGRSTKPNK